MELRDPFIKYYLMGHRKTRPGCGSKLKRGLPQKHKVGVVSDGRHWDQLPTEMLFLIFSYLSPTELACSVFGVCTRWHDVAIPFIKRLKFNRQGATEDVVRLVEKSTHLESIDLHNRNDFQPILAALFKNCENSNTDLKEISLRVGPRASRFPARVEGVLIGNRSRYCCLSPACSPDYCKLQIINAPYSTNLMKFCPKLERLELQNLTIRHYGFYGEIGTKLRSLTQLTIIRCYQFTSGSLKLIAENCTLLSHVTLLHNVRPFFSWESSNATTWEQAYHDLIRKRGPRLQVLEIEAIPLFDSTFLALSTSTNLHTLTLEGAKNLYILGITAISTLRHLKHLIIHDSNHFYYGLYGISFARLFDSGNLDQLETLGLPSCGYIDDSCLDVISRSCPNLNAVDFSHCSKITYRGFKLLMLRCTKLRVLNLYPMVERHHALLRLIPDKTPSLKLLVIGQFCDEAMVKSIEELVARCPNTQVKPEMDGSLLIRFM